MTDAEYQAAKFSFKQVPETCPLVYKAFDDYMASNRSKQDVDNLLEFVKTQTTALRDLTLKLGERLVAANIPLQA